MKFEEALVALRNGCAVRISTWNSSSALLLNKCTNDEICGSFRWVTPDWGGTLKETTTLADRLEVSALLSDKWEIVWTPPTQPVENVGPDPEVIPG